MMAEIRETMLAASSSLFASILVKATVACCIALGAVWLSRRSRAAVRHVWLAAAFAVLLALPIAALLAPPLRITVRGTAEPIAFRMPGLHATSSGLPAAPLRTAVPPEASQTSKSLLPRLLLAGWMAGAAIFLLPVAMGLWQVRSLRRSALPWRQGQSAAERLTGPAGIRRPVSVLLHDTLSGPMTCGVIHPAIVLPDDAGNWQPDDLDRALVHELEHVRRFDWLCHCLARTVCALYWFHPLVWVARRKLVLEAERSCDDGVLGRSEATAYADQLVCLAQRLSGSGRSPLLAMASRADLARRVSAVLDGRQRRGRAGRLAIAVASAAALVSVLALAPLQVVAAPQAVDVMSNVSIRSVSALVIAGVTVTSANGQSIVGLAASDFVLTEDGAPQNIRVFEYESATPTGYYILGYYPSNRKTDGQSRKIQVTCTANPAATLNYRTGYTVKPFVEPARPVMERGATAINPGLKPPALLFKVEPEYSDEARKAKYQGRVLLDVDLDASGDVSNVHVAQSLGLGLDEKAVEAVKRWKFRPAMKDGQPAPIRFQTEVIFQLW
jgi:TonB family protein